MKACDKPDCSGAGCLRGAGSRMGTGNYEMRHCGWTSRLVSLAAALACAGAAAAAELDLRAWQALPVFDQRMTSLDTFARWVVETICGDPAPTLSLAGAGLGAGAAAPAAARQLFHDDQPRRFPAAELLLSWLIEPEKWEGVPFLVAEDRQLRAEILGLPLYDAAGRRLRYISPGQLAHNEGFFRRWEELRRRAAAEGERFELSGVERQLDRLRRAYDTYRYLTFDPSAADESRTRFVQRFRALRQSWARLVQALQAAGRLSREDQSGRLVIEAGEGLDQVAQLFHAPEFRLDEMDAAAAALSRQMAAIQKHFAAAEPRAWALIAQQLARQAAEMHLALYDNGSALRLIPALNPSALEANRPPEDDAHPWLSFQALFYGSRALLADYPQAELDAVRLAFERVRQAYLMRQAPERPARFATAMDEFAAALGRLGAAVEPIRTKLPLAHRDEQLLRATAYPPPGAMDIEVFYNRLDPFYWSWLMDLVAVVCLAFSLGVLRRAAFAAGLAVLFAAQAIVLAGLALRWKITGLVPLTGMFETVVFMGLATALLGIWFVFSPLLWPGLRAGWRLAAVPLTPKSALGTKDREPWGPARWQKGPWLLLLPRVGLTGVLAWWLVDVPGLKDQGYFHLVPQRAIAAAWPTLDSTLVWGAGLCVWGLILYGVPRLALALAVGLAATPWVWTRRRGPELAERVAARKPFALVGAVVALLAAVLAYYGPPTIILGRGLESPKPVLRDNFWLLVHVVTITASYAAGALAWGLGNVALGFYLFGRYEPQAAGGTGSEGRAARAPAACTRLAGYTYRALQLAVFLLAAGTILGAMWGDVAWGRFWDWDPKEVWALVTLLAYMVILHGRHLGWVSQFGIVLAAVAGFGAIVMAWYGVNFVLGTGLHAYASGAGGQVWVGAAALVNLLLLLCAAARYLSAKHG